ncbi:MAG: TonB-dependent receptor, partial [Prevotellaceae bacterium]|nr:TonB-dependent receptor [Prevotellaceae bacterium]
GFTDVASSASANSSRTWNYLVENTLSFNKTFGSHDIIGVLGQSYQDTQGRSMRSAKTDLIKSAGGLYLQNVSGGITLSDATGSSYQARLISYFGRVNYDFADRYLLQATVRRDGTSRFGPGYKWGTFPSVSAGWQISNEPFYNINWMNTLKLRANYGTLGSQNVGNYDYQSLINSYTGYAYNGGLQLTPGQAVTAIANAGIAWEKRETINIGLDANFLDNRLQTSIEYYISKSKDVLYAQSILKSVGSTSNPIVNSASLENKGVEVTATWRDNINRDWSYSVGVNLSHNQNTLTGLGYGVDSYDAQTTLSKVGEPIGLFYLVKTDGLYQSDEEAKAHGVISNATAGDVKYVDFDGSKSINNGDRQLLTDKSPWPKLEGSLNIMVNYKDWSLQLFGFGQFFKWVYNGSRLTTDALSGQSNIRRDYFNNMWSTSNAHNDVWYPRTGWNYTFNDISYSDRWLERGDFFKISSLSLSYNYRPKGVLSTIIRGAKISVTAQNFLCLTGFSGYDPDFNAGMFTPGNTGNNNGSPRSLVFGVNLNF